MRNKIRLTESDLISMIKKIIKEHVQIGTDYKPEEFGQEFKGKKGTWYVDDYGNIIANVEGDNDNFYSITSNPNRGVQQGQQPAKESYLRKGRRLY